MSRFSPRVKAPLAITYRPVADLRPAERNARTHSPAQVAQLVSSVREFGWTNPILLDEGAAIVAGHGRLEAARKLGMAEVPTITLTGLTAAQKRALALADNKLALNAGWDDELLRLELGDLKLDGFDLSLIGFSDDELASILADRTEGLTDPDDAPEVPADPVSRLGDVWVMGRHRLVCGDCTDAGVVETALAGKLADLCFTSPPYGQQRAYTTGGIADWDGLMRGAFGALRMAPAGQVLVNLGLIHRDGEWLPYWDGWIEWMRAAGWRRFGWYVWDQGPGMPGSDRGRLASSYEFIFHFNHTATQTRKTKAKLAASIAVAHGTGQREANDQVKGYFNSPEAGLQSHKIPDNVIRVMRQKARGIETAHPAVFPVALATEIITAFTDAGDTTYEPFSGSGTTIIAAEMTGRACHAIEIAPAYIDVAVRRWQSFTGQVATLEATGETFAAMEASRVER